MEILNSVQNAELKYNKIRKNNQGNLYYLGYLMPKFIKNIHKKLLMWYNFIIEK